MRSNLLVAGFQTRILGRAAIRWASAFQVAAGLAGMAEPKWWAWLGGGVGHCWVVGGVDAPAGVEEDPPVLAPQHRGGAGGGAWVDEVSEVERGGDVAVLDDLDAVAARRNRVGRASEGSGVCPAPAREDGGLAVCAGGSHDFAVTASAGGDLCCDGRSW